MQDEHQRFGIESSQARPRDGEGEVERGDEACRSNGRSGTRHPSWQSERQQNQQKQACHHVVLRAKRSGIKSKDRQAPGLTATDGEQRKGGAYAPQAGGGGKGVGKGDFCRHGEADGRTR